VKVACIVVLAALAAMPSRAIAGQVADDPHTPLAPQAQSLPTSSQAEMGLVLINGSLFSTFTGHVVGGGVECGSCSWPAGTLTPGSLRRRASFEIGVVIDSDRDSRFGIVPELLYGQKSTFDEFNQRLVHLQYVEAPVLLRVGLSGVRRRHRVYLMGGPAVDLKLAERSNTSFSAPSLSTRNYNTVDLVVIGGVGAEIGPYVLQARENVDLRRAFAGSTNASSRIHTQSFAMIVGLRLR
jgi:hypothetical protein